MNVYMSARKSMTIRSYIHSSHKRAETTALLDSGATENFMSLEYAKWLHLPIKSLKDPCPLFNVDGTTNKQGDIKFYTDLTMRLGTIQKNMRFFLSNLGTHQMILGYPWFATIQPKIDWAKGWIDVSHLPIVLSAVNAQKAKFTPRPSVVMRSHAPIESTYMVYVSFLPSRLNPIDQQNLEKIPLKYRRHAKVFSESAAQHFPESHIWDHAIKLKPGAPSSLLGKIYSLMIAEQEELSPASRVESHDLVVWLWTGVSSGNRPTNVLKSRKYRAHRLKARTLGVSGTPVSDAVGKLGDLRDRSSDKIRTLICLDWDPDCMFPFTDDLSCHRVSYACPLPCAVGSD